MEEIIPNYPDIRVLCRSSCSVQEKGITRGGDFYIDDGFATRQTRKPSVRLALMHVTNVPRRIRPSEAGWRLSTKSAVFLAVRIDPKEGSHVPEFVGSLFRTACETERGNAWQYQCDTSTAKPAAGATY